MNRKDQPAPETAANRKARETLEAHEQERKRQDEIDQTAHSQRSDDEQAGRAKRSAEEDEAERAGAEKRAGGTLKDPTENTVDAPGPGPTGRRPTVKLQHVHEARTIDVMPEHVAEKLASGLWLRFYPPGVEVDAAGSPLASSSDPLNPEGQPLNPPLAPEPGTHRPSADPFKDSPTGKKQS